MARSRFRGDELCGQDDPKISGKSPRGELELFGVHLPSPGPRWHPFDFLPLSHANTQQPGRKLGMHKIAIPQAAIDRVLKRRESLHVFGDIDPLRTAHIVVDLQNGFMAPGQPVEIPEARDIVPNVNRISAALRAAGGLVVYIQNTIDATAKAAWSNWFTHMSGDGRREAMDAAFADGS